MTVALDAKSGWIAPASGVTSFTDSSFTVGKGVNGALVVALVCQSTKGNLPTAPVLVWDNGIFGLTTNQPMGTSTETLKLVARDTVQEVYTTTPNVVLVDQRLPGCDTSIMFFGLVAPTMGNKQLSVSGLNANTSCLISYISFFGVNQAGGQATFKHGVATLNSGTITETANAWMLQNEAAVAVFGEAGTLPSVNNAPWAAAASTSLNVMSFLSNYVVGPGGNGPIPTAIPMTASWSPQAPSNVIAMTIAAYVPGRTAVDYANGWNDLLPDGDAWPRDPTTTLQRVITAFSQIWETEVETLSSLLLITESYPWTTNLLLPEWERAWKLPDPCLGELNYADVGSRRSALVGKMTFLGAQSRQWFEGIALSYAGENVSSIVEFSPYQCGISGCGDTTNIEPEVDDTGFHGAPNTTYRWVLGDVPIRFSWKVIVTGISVFSNANLYCLFSRWKPAHTEVIIDYSGISWMRFDRQWNTQYLSLF